MSGGTVAVVPIRSLTGGKTRLSGAVDVEARAELIRLMLCNVLRALSETDGVDRVVVVSPDLDALDLAIEMLPTVVLLRQPLDAPGLLPALELGRRHAVEQGAGAVLIVFGDLPRVTSADLDVMLSRDAEVVLAPDRDLLGTNALLLRGDAVAAFPFRFGERSFPAHRDDAWEMGYDPSVVARPGLAFDLDTPADLAGLPDEMVTVASWMTAP